MSLSPVEEAAYFAIGLEETINQLAGKVHLIQAGQPVAYTTILAETIRELTEGYRLLSIIGSQNLQRQEDINSMLHLSANLSHIQTLHNLVQRLYQTKYFRG